MPEKNAELLEKFGYSADGSMKGGLIVLTRYLAKELSPGASGSTPLPPVRHAPGSWTTRSISTPR